MATRRMISKAIVDSSSFVKMPSSSRLLYYDLIIRADDEGIVEAYNVMRLTGCSEDDLKVLSAKRFVTVLNDDLVTHISKWDDFNTFKAGRKIPSIYKGLLLRIENLCEQEADLVAIDTIGKNGATDIDLDLDIDKISKENNIRAFFESVWEAYPKKKGKAQVAKKSKEAIYKLGDEIFRCIDRYVKSCTDMQYMQYGSTFFNSGYIDYLDANYKEDKPVEQVKYKGTIYERR